MENLKEKIVIDKKLVTKGSLNVVIAILNQVQRDGEKIVLLEENKTHLIYGKKRS